MCVSAKHVSMYLEIAFMTDKTGTGNAAIHDCNYGTVLCCVDSGNSMSIAVDLHVLSDLNKIVGVHDY